MTLKVEGRRLQLIGPEGTPRDFHALWLRENSRSEDFRDPITGHKLQDAAALPLDLHIVEASERTGEVDLRFSDGHRASYSTAALQEARDHLFPQELVGEKTLWSASLDPLPWHELASLRADPQNLLAFLADIACFGFGLVRGVPIAPDGMKQVTDLIGYLRWTNSGGIADVKSMAEAYDLSMTPRGLEPHVDNPYRLPQPGYTLLHCLENDAEGGESILIDGFYVAEHIRNERPDFFEVLSSVPVTFRYVDEQAILEHTSPFIDLWPDGSLKQTRFHGRADQVVAADPELLDAFYEARRMYAGLIASDEIQLLFKLKPGEMYFADNFRLFHGRAPFRLETGTRHMRQAYMDRDVVSSRQKTLLRNIDAKPWQPRD